MMPAQASASAPAVDDPRFGLLDATLKRFGYSKDALIEVLHTAQEVFGHLSPELLGYVAKELKLPTSQVYGVATFYHLFTFKPLGEHTCTVCMGTACYVKGAEEILNQIRIAFGINPGETSNDGQLSVISARCVGSCGLAPVVIIDNEVIGKEPPEKIVTRLKALIGQPEEARA